MNDEVIILKERFTRDKHLKQYATLPFDMPDGVEEITVRYDYDRVKHKIGMTPDDQNEIDIALFGIDGKYIGSSGWARSEFVVSECYATPGYKRTKIEPGKWAVSLGFCKIKHVGADVVITITCKKKERRFYKGDCHVHTFHSDGRLSPEGVVKKAVKNKLDFFISTDHNTNTACGIFPQTRGLNIIPGLELTSYAGHFNLLGCEKPVDDEFRFTTIEELNRLLVYAGEQGAVLSMNHPLCKNCGWRLPFEGFPIDCAELWNGPMRIDNVNAVNWWHEELKKGRKIVAIGGSDYHTDFVVTNLLANPCTVVYAEGNTQKDIMDGIRRGHVYVTSHPDTSMLNLECGDKMMGDTVEWKEGTKVKLTATKLKKGYILRVYNNDTVLYERTGKGEEEIVEELTVKEKGFVRAQIDYKMSPAIEPAYRLILKFTMPLDAKAEFPLFNWAYSNPIYFE